MVFLAVAYSAPCEVQKEILSYNLDESQPSKTILEVGGPDPLLQKVSPEIWIVVKSEITCL